MNLLKKNVEENKVEEKKVSIEEETKALEDISWKEKVTEFIDTISNVFSSNKKEEISVEKLKDEFDEIKNNVKLKDGILYANSHLDIKKENIKLTMNNVLIVFPKTVTNKDGTTYQEPQRMLKYSKDNWFQVVEPFVDITKIEIVKVKTLS